MIDIHTHILNDVDDGASSIEESIEMLKEQVKQGVTVCILTPHFKRYKEDKEKFIDTQFLKLKDKVQELNLPIHLYLGKEVYYRDSLLELDNRLAIKDTPYVLVEFSTRVDPQIDEAVYNLKVLKLKPIIAHIERYSYLKKSDYSKLKKTGALIQVNAAAIIGSEGLKRRFLSRYLLKHQLVDIVASDSHNMSTRKPNLKKAYQKVYKKYGRAYAERLFLENPKKVLDAIK